MILRLIINHVIPAQTNCIPTRRFMSNIKLNILFLWVSFMIPLYAQQPDSLEIFQGDTIKVVADRYDRFRKYNSISAKMRMEIIDTPASIAKVSQALIEEQNALSLSDALKNISGINVQSGLGVQDFFIVRGFESTTSGLILSDGIHDPVNSLFNFYGFGPFDLYNVEELEVLKGPSSYLYGVNTLSGVVNLVYKKPLDKDFCYLSAIYGRYDYYRIDMDCGKSVDFGNIAFRLNGFWQNAISYRIDKPSNRFALNPVFRWQLSEKDAIEVRFEYSNDRVKPDVGIPLYLPGQKWELPDISPLTSYQSQVDQVDRNSVRFRIDYTRYFNRKLSLVNKLYATKLNGGSYLTMPHVPYRSTAGGWLVDRHVYHMTERQFVIGNQLEFGLNFETGAIKHNVVLGIDAILQENTADRNISLLDLTGYFNPKSETGGRDDLLWLNTIHTEINRWNLAPYLVYHTDIGQDLKILAGGRLDIINKKGNRLNDAFDYIQKILRSEPGSISIRYTNFNPMIALSYRDSETLRFYINYGEAFSADATSLNEPEISRQWELGYKFISGDDRFQHTFAVFQILKENMTIPLIGPLQGDIREPIGSQRSRGIEADFYARILSRLYAQLNYSYTEAEFINYRELSVTEELTTELLDFSGNVPPFVPGHLMNIWFFNYFTNGLGIGFGTTYTGGQYIHADNNFLLPGYFLFNAALIFRFERGGWKINVNNITDQQYYVRGLGPYTLIPAPPITIFISLYYNI